MSYTMRLIELIGFNAKDTLKIISYTVKTSAFIHVFTSNFFSLSETSGESMLPTLHINGDWCIVDRRYRYGRGLKIGDFIMASKPSDPEQGVCKRITGMPGDIILIDPSKNTLSNLESDSKLDSDGFTIREIKTRESLEIKQNFNQYIIVPEGHCWVTGENLSDSIDSRTYSVMPLGLVSGKLTHAWLLPSSWWNILDFREHSFRKLDNKNELEC